MVFDIDGEKQTLDLRGGQGKTYKGKPENDEKPELTLTISDDNFAKLVMGKLGPQQVYCLMIPAQAEERLMRHPIQKRILYKYKYISCALRLNEWQSKF